MRHRYRVVSDKYAGYEAQVKYWWFPLVWWQMHNNYNCNTFTSYEKAVEFIREKERQRKLGRFTREVSEVELAE